MARRGSGEGTIYHRADGRWEAKIDLGWEDGGRRRKAVYGRTRSEVQEKLAAALEAKREGTLVPGKMPNMEAFLAHWLAEVKRTIRPKTYVSYEGAVRLYLILNLRKVRLDKLTPVHVQHMQRALETRGVSPRNRQYSLQVLRIALNKGIKWNLLIRNVAQAVDPPRVITPDALVLDPDQACAFLEVAAKDRLGILYIVALTLGLRQGEVLGLPWKNVDLQSRTLLIERSLQRITGVGLQFVPVKSRKGERKINLPKFLVSALRKHGNRQNQERLIAGNEWEEHGLVFTNPIGAPLDGRSVTKRLKKILASANLPMIRFHDLRHSAASLLGAEHIPPRVVMEVLGHSRISVTLDLYSKVFSPQLEEAANAMERVLGRQDGRQST